MSEREKALQLLDRVPDYKLEYVIAFLQGAAIPESKPNAETINEKETALKELLQMTHEGTITDYEKELASHREEKYLKQNV